MRLSLEEVARQGERCHGTSPWELMGVECACGGRSWWKCIDYHSATYVEVCDKCGKWTDLHSTKG